VSVVLKMSMCKSVCEWKETGRAQGKGGTNTDENWPKRKAGADDRRDLRKGWAVVYLCARFAHKDAGAYEGEEEEKEAGGGSVEHLPLPALPSGAFEIRLP
jgi:hypothetical protein